MARGARQPRLRDRSDIPEQLLEEAPLPAKGRGLVARRIDLGDRLLAALLDRNDIASGIEFYPEHGLLSHLGIAEGQLRDTNSELEEITLRAAKAVGGGILGIDLMEDKKRGYLVHEINNTVEFRGASMVSTQDIPAAMIDYLVHECRK